MQWDEGGWRILLGDNTGGGAVMMLPVRFQCAGGWISTELLCIYTCSWPYVHAVLSCSGPCECEHMSALTVANKVKLFYCNYHLQLQSRRVGFCFTPVLRAAERNGFLVGRCVNLNRAQEDTWTLDLITCSSLLSYSNPHCGDEVGPGWAVITGTWIWQASCWGLLLCCVYK